MVVVCELNPIISSFQQFLVTNKRNFHAMKQSYEISIFDEKVRFFFTSTKKCEVKGDSDGSSKTRIPIFTNISSKFTSFFHVLQKNFMNFTKRLDKICILNAYTTA